MHLKKTSRLEHFVYVYVIANVHVCMHMYRFMCIHICVYVYLGTYMEAGNPKL
jgi:hypothetical protein